MDKKQIKVLTEFEKKFIELEKKQTQKINEFLATTNINVAVYKKAKKGREDNGRLYCLSRYVRVRAGL